MNENNDHTPPDLGTLIVAEDLTPSVFVCPKTNDEMAEGKDKVGWAKNLNDPAKKRSSYFYVAGPIKEDDADQVLAFEPPENHDGEGANVLFADGHVDFESIGREGEGRKAYDKFFADYKAGVRPLHWPVRP